jgi:hypothetical protein
MHLAVSQTHPPDATDALAEAVRHGTNQVEVACVECGCLLLLVASDAAVDRVGRYDQVEVCDLDGDTLVRCPGCLTDELEPATVTLPAPPRRRRAPAARLRKPVRDRHRRCARVGVA